MAAAAILGFGAPAFGQTTVSVFAPSTNTDPGVWFENDVRPGGTASIAELSGIGGDLENNQPLPSGAAKLTTDFSNAAKGEVGLGNLYGEPQNIFSSINISFSLPQSRKRGAAPGTGSVTQVGVLQSAMRRPGQLVGTALDRSFGKRINKALAIRPSMSGPPSRLTKTTASSGLLAFSVSPVVSADVLRVAARPCPNGLRRCQPIFRIPIWFSSV